MDRLPPSFVPVDGIPPVWESSLVNASYRTRRLLAVAAVALAVAIALPRFLTHTPYPRFGAEFDYEPSRGLTRITKAEGPPSRGLLQKGDVLLLVEGRPSTQEEWKKLKPQGGYPKGPLDLVIERNGQVLRLTLPPLRLSVWMRVRLYIYPLATIIAAPLVAFLLVWRRPDLSAAWTFFWFAALQAVSVVWDLFRFPQGGVGQLFRSYLSLYGALICWYPAAFLHFMTVFPRPRWRRPGPSSNFWFWLVVLAYATPPVLWVFGHGPIKAYSGAGMLWFQTIALPLGTLSLIEHYARRDRAGYQPRPGERVLALAVAATLLLNAASSALWQSPQFMDWFSFPLVRLAATSITFAFLAAPLVIAFLIANDPVFDPRRVVVQSLPFALLSVVLAGIYLAVVLASQRLFAAATGEESMIFNVVAALVVAFAFAPLWTRTQHALDRLFGRDPQALRVALDQTGRELLGALDHDELRRSVEAGLTRGLKREVALEWAEPGPPRLAAGEALPEHAQRAVENLLLQAGIRLENLVLQEHRAAAERQAVELREAATRAELRALQAQVQPHFLFNALNALAYLIETDPPGAQRFSMRLADMLRYTVEAGNRPVALLSEEIGFVEDYLGVARERYETPLEFAYRGPRELLSLAVPPLLLQPLVENSLKHGCAPNAPGLHLELVAGQDDGFIELTFSDDGVASSSGAPGLGVGLANLEQRLRRFAGADATMEAGARWGAGGTPQPGFVVRLRWPVMKGASR
jgi:hypothetical protein